MFPGLGSREADFSVVLNFYFCPPLPFFLANRTVRIAWHTRKPPVKSATAVGTLTTGLFRVITGYFLLSTLKLSWPFFEKSPYPFLKVTCGPDQGLGQSFVIQTIPEAGLKAFVQNGFG